MRNLRAFLWAGVLLAAALVALTPLIYLLIGARLPQLESEFDLERVLRQSIESERRSALMGRLDRQKQPIEFKRPDFAQLPKNLVAAYISERNCPSYLQSPREEGFPWTKRELLRLVNIEPPGNGWCEHLFGALLGERIGARGALEVAVATHKIHRFLKKDSLIAYNLHSLRLAPGVIGVEDGAKELFKRPLSELNLAQTAEYALALPPNGHWEQIRTCQNPTLIRQARDMVIQRLLSAALIPQSEAREAQGEPVACLKTE